MTSRSQWPLVILILLLALGVFAGRGLMRGWKSPGDLVLIYSMTRAWLHGDNPYDLASCDRWWLNGGGAEQDRPSRHGRYTLLYPPTAFIFCLPIAVLTWPAAKGFWIAANCVLLGISVCFLGRAAGMQFRERSLWLFAAGTLCFSPTHTTIAHGQTALVALALLAAGIFFREKRLNGHAGVLTAAASLFKPQLGLPFLAWNILLGRRKALAGSAMVSLPLVAIGILPMILSRVPWWDSWQGNLVMFTVAGMGNPTRANPSRYQLVNLHFLLHTLMDNSAAVEVLAAATVAVLALVFFLRLRSSRNPAADRGLLSASMIAVLTLLVFYHRFHDAVLLLVPLAWCMISIRDVRTATAYVIVALLLPFFLNSASVLAVATQNNRISHEIAASRLWEVLIVPHQVWALLLMAICLAVEAGGSRTRGESGAPSQNGAGVNRLSC